MNALTSQMRGRVHKKRMQAADPALVCVVDHLDPICRILSPIIRWITASKSLYRALLRYRNDDEYCVRGCAMEAGFFPQKTAAKKHVRRTKESHRNEMSGVSKERYGRWEGGALFEGRAAMPRWRGRGRSTPSGLACNLVASSSTGTYGCTAAHGISVCRISIRTNDHINTYA
jgi:hypothetical protein